MINKKMMVKAILREVKRVLDLQEEFGWTDVTKLRIAYRRAKDAKAI